MLPSRSEGEAPGLLGVAFTVRNVAVVVVPPTPASGGTAAVSLVDLDGVAVSRRSNRPSTRPSLWGVGPMDVGTAGLKSFLESDGVAAALGLWPE